MKDRLISSTLQSLQIKNLNKLQLQAIDAIEKNNQIIILAPTGSGKTLAFLIPVYLQLKNNTSIQNPSIVIITPTRELALQIQTVWKAIQTGFKSVACYGGHQIQTEINELIETPALIIGTPGRIRDHITRQTINAETFTTCIIDEFDKTLELGFEKELEDIFLTLTNLEKIILASATQIENLPKFININNPITIDCTKDVNENNTKKYLLETPDKDKLTTLEHLITCELNGTAIIFVNYRESAQRVFDHLMAQKIDCVFYHGGLEQLDREIAIMKFKNGTANILIASDIASRGLDIDNVSNIIHYHLPATNDAYIHRNGRTARQLAKGNIFILKHTEEELPEFITEDLQPFIIKNMPTKNWQSNWITLTINAGKKNKINKIDIVGFLSKIGKLQKQEIGIINVLDTVSFVAVAKPVYKDALANIRNQKIKGKDYIFKTAK